MEGWFWRFTDAAAGRVVVALCGVNRHPAGDWATVAIAAHPGGVVRSAVVAPAGADADRFAVRAGADGDTFDAGPGHVRVHVGDATLDVTLPDIVGWPLRLGGGGVFSALPWLGQYWHPHVLGGQVEGGLTVAGETWDLDRCTVYAEKNWGAGFPERWWWGQADAFGGDDVCVAFGGGRLQAGPVGFDVGGCVVRLGARVVRFAPPGALVRTTVADGCWTVRARRPGWQLDIAGDGDGHQPHVLPVPVPAERRNVDTDLEHLAGHMHVTVRRRGAVVFDGTSHLAGLELGTTDTDVARRQRDEFAVSRASGRPGSRGWRRRPPPGA